MTPPRLRLALVATACLIGAGCVSSNVLNANETGVWVKEPLIGPGDPAAIAREHCARYGKDAEFDTEFAVAEGEFRSVHVFICR